MTEQTPPGTPGQTKVKLIAISPETFQAVVEYLSRKPYNEVAELLNSLSQNQVLEGTILRKEPNGEPAT